MFGSAATPHLYQYTGPVLTAEDQALFCLLYPLYQTRGGVAFDDMVKSFKTVVLQKWDQDKNNILKYSMKTAHHLKQHEQKRVRELEVAANNQRVIMMQGELHGSGSKPTRQMPGGQTHPPVPGFNPHLQSGMPYLSPYGSIPAMPPSGQSARIPFFNVVDGGVPLHVMQGALAVPAGAIGVGKGGKGGKKRCKLCSEVCHMWIGKAHLHRCHCTLQRAGVPPLLYKVTDCRKGSLHGCKCCLCKP